jgi:hypothetical protein
VLVDVCMPTEPALLAKELDDPKDLREVMVDLNNLLAVPVEAFEPRLLVFTPAPALGKGGNLPKDNHLVSAFAPARL